MHTLPISHIRQQLPQIVRDVGRGVSDSYGITVDGVLSAHIVSHEYLESLLETIEILQDKKLMRDLRESHSEAMSGDVISLSEYLDTM